MLLFFHIAYFPKTTVDTLIEDIFLYNMIIWDLCKREPIISKMPFSLRGAVMPGPRLPYVGPCCFELAILTTVTPSLASVAVDTYRFRDVSNIGYFLGRMRAVFQVRYNAS